MLLLLLAEEYAHQSEKTSSAAGISTQVSLLPAIQRNGDRLFVIERKASKVERWMVVNNTRLDLTLQSVRTVITSLVSDGRISSSADTTVTSPGTTLPHSSYARTDVTYFK